MRWLVGWSLRLRYLVAALAFGLLFLGVQVLGHEKLDVFPEFAPVSVEIQTTCLGLSPQDVESLTTVRPRPAVAAAAVWTPTRCAPSWVSTTLSAPCGPVWAIRAVSGSFGAEVAPHPVSAASTAAAAMTAHAAERLTRCTNASSLT